MIDMSGIKILIGVLTILLVALSGCIENTVEVNNSRSDIVNNTSDSDASTTENITENSTPSSQVSYRGSILAGTNSKLLEFTKEEYDRALASDKLVVLYFYAGWCPTCRAEFPKMEDAFDELTTDRVIGFRVNYNDGDTEQAEKDLAKEYGVTYQHTKVFVKNNDIILRSLESWSKQRYLDEINKAI